MSRGPCMFSTHFAPATTASDLVIIMQCSSFGRLFSTQERSPTGTTWIGPQVARASSSFPKNSEHTKRYAHLYCPDTSRSREQSLVGKRRYVVADQVNAKRMLSSSTASFSLVRAIIAIQQTRTNMLGSPSELKMPKNYDFCCSRRRSRLCQIHGTIHHRCSPLLTSIWSPRLSPC
jgi:hypothetical protein